MDQAQEIMQMNKLLEVEDLSFKLQLEDAVSFSHLSRSDVFCYLLKNCFMVLLATSTFYSLPGLFRHQPDSGGGGCRPAQL